MIKKIYINKFRKLENITESKIGNVNELYGKNGCGKTSFLNFISWVITGSTLDFGVNDDSNIDEENPYILIGGEITCYNAKTELEYTFAREYGYEEENPTKKINNFFVNGRKVSKQNEYYDSIKKAFNVNCPIDIKKFDILRALTDVYYLSNGDVETQFRELITSLLNIDTDTILFSREDNEFESIKKEYYLNDCDYDKTKDFFNQKVKELESKIAEIESQIKVLSETSFDEKEYEELGLKINNLKNNNLTFYNEKRDVLRKELDSVYVEYQNSIIEDKKKNISLPQEEEIAKLKTDYNNKVELYQKESIENANKISQIANCKYQQQRLEVEYNEIKESSFKDIICPHCNGVVNESEKDTFNKTKASKLKQLQKSIDENKNKIDGLLKQKCIDLEKLKNTLNSLYNDIKIKEKELQELIEETYKNYVSENTKQLESKIKDLETEYNALVLEDENKTKASNEEQKKQLEELENKYREMYNASQNAIKLKMVKESKFEKAKEKGIYVLKRELLERFKKAEITLVQQGTSNIFGDDFEFVMQEKQKSNDKYKKVCYAKVNGVKYTKKNTAEAIVLGIVIMEKIKTYIGGCDLPILFDICDNIGKSARDRIFNQSTSQLFYTRIDDEDKSNRILNIIK